LLQFHPIASIPAMTAGWEEDVRGVKSSAELEKLIHLGLFQLLYSKEASCMESDGPQLLFML
jgi:hypothetical protein